MLACGHNPGGPGPDPVQPIAFQQPPDVTVENVMGSSQVVTYPTPTTTGGIPPVTITCTPASGSTFQLGETTVQCSATDGVRSAVTQFKVILVPFVPTIGATKFLAFGDSITNGEVQTNPMLLEVIEAKAYPTVLQNEMSMRYTAQTISVINAGQSGESAEDGSRRIGSYLSLYHPEGLLLLQGVIDLGDGPSKIPVIVSSLRSDIVQAKNQNVKHIFLGTLLPQKTPSPGYQRNNIAMPYIEDANVQIRALASSENVYLVDAYQAFAGKTATLIGGDGLHPTEEGYQVLANTFFDVIKAKLEVGSSPQRRRGR
jgi:lysophospholipase L1-like esterase